MKNIKKNALKIVVLVALFAPAAFADGDMPGGGLASSGNGTNGGEIITTQTAENTSVGSGQTTATDDVNSLLSAIYEYLGLIM